MNLKATSANNISSRLVSSDTERRMSIRSYNSEEYYREDEDDLSEYNLSRASRARPNIMKDSKSDMTI